jgi:hypothetical protein
VAVFKDGSHIDQVVARWEGVPIFDPEVQVGSESYRYCTWMPFQKGQATLTQQLEERLAGELRDIQEQRKACAEQLAEIRKLSKGKSGSVLRRGRA